MNLRQNLMIILGQQEIRHFLSCIVCSLVLWSDVASDHWITRKLNRVLRRDCPVRVEARVTPAPASKRAEDREFVVDSGASMDMLSNNVLSSKEMETLRRSGNPTNVVTDTGEVQKIEEAQVFVHDLDLFGLHFYHLEHFAKDLDLFGLYFYHLEHFAKKTEWSSGKQPRLTKKRKIDAKKVIAYVLLSWIVVQVLVRVHPPHRHRQTRQVHHQVHLQVQHQSEVPSSEQEIGRVIHQKPENKNQKER